MPEPLKNYYTRDFFDKLAPAFEAALPAYRHSEFLSKVFTKEWKTFELKQRVRHIARCLHFFMPAAFPEAVLQLVKASVLLRENKEKQYGYFCIFFCDYLEEYGLNYFKESMEAIEELTQLASAEFCIRQFILKYPEKSMKQMLKWSKHPNEHVRRLSSEGCRPRLPWAIALQKFKKDPSPVLPVLENLKEDPSEYVRRSVANNLNDIAKDHPDLVLELVSKWKGKHPHTDWIIKHGCRTLLKRGNTQALSSLGFNARCKVEVTVLKLSSKKFGIGETLGFSFQLKLLEKKAAQLRLEYGIDYVKSNGSTSRKIFKITERTFQPGESCTVTRKQRFTDFTTRKHYPGKHRLCILVNGQEYCSNLFEITRK